MPRGSRPSTAAWFAYHHPPTGGRWATQLSQPGAIICLMEKHLAEADRHIAELKTLISGQETLIGQLAAEEQPTQLAETLLATMKDTLRMFEQHRQLMLAQIEKPS